jgi:hypothetical protein
MDKKKIDIKWLAEPEEHDYPAAKSFLSLIYTDRVTAGFVQKLRRAPVSQFKAKDIFRASGLSLLGISNLTWRRIEKRFSRAKGFPRSFS